MNPEVIVTIGPDGEVKMEVKGIDGPACLERTKGVFAGSVLEQRKTAEYHQLAETAVQQKVELGG